MVRESGGVYVVFQVSGLINWWIIYWGQEDKREIMGLALQLYLRRRSKQTTLYHRAEFRWNVSVRDIDLGVTETIRVDGKENQGETLEQETRSILGSASMNSSVLELTEE